MIIIRIIRTENSTGIVPEYRTGSFITNLTLEAVGIWEETIRITLFFI